MKTNNISLSQTKSGQRYTYTLLNTKLPKSNGSREFGGNGDGGLELQNYLQEYIDNGWRLIQLELVTLNVSSQTHDVLKTGRREIINLDAWGFLQGLVLLEAGLLDHVDFTGDDGIELGLRVTDDDPFHPVKVHRSAACQAAGRFGARHVLGVALVHRDGAGLEFIGLEDEGGSAL